MTEIAPNERLYSIVVGFIGGVVSLLGLVTNCLSLPVLLRKEMRASNSTLCLIMLGVYDLVLLVIDFITTSLDWAVFGLDPDALFLYKFTMPASVVCDPIVMILVTGSVYTTVILSLDRCMAVLRPLHWASTFTRKRIKTALVVVFIFALIVDAPMYFQAELHMVYYPKFNATFVGGKPTEYYFSWFHQEIYMKQIMPVFQIIIPLILIVSSNAAIVAKVVVHKRKSNALRGRVKTSNSIPTPQPLDSTAAIAETVSSTYNRDRQFIMNPLSLASNLETGKRSNERGDISHYTKKYKTAMAIPDTDRSVPDLGNFRASTDDASQITWPMSSDDIGSSRKTNNHGTTTPTTTTTTNSNTVTSLNNTTSNKLHTPTTKNPKIRSKSHGVDLSKLTAQVVAISLITLISRSVAAANFYIVTEEDIFYVKYCSRACGWTGALNILFIKINSSVNFVFYCFFGGKFRTVFKSTFGCFRRKGR